MDAECKLHRDINELQRSTADIHIEWLYFTAKNFSFKPNLGPKPN